GLGLAIVEAAVNQHRGWVKAEDSPLGGLRLVLWLPLHHQRLSSKTEQEEFAILRPSFTRGLQHAEHRFI
ncbi:hypothetical protein KQX66_36490, partial [Paenibacillus sp. SM 69]|nr:hypothetical protein [Paenibacillus oleatilyticus]